MLADPWGRPARVEMRRPTLAELAGRRHQVLIVGGGIIGCGTARDAALRGLRVALVERDDFGAGTTSRSTRLIHGGLRYLEQYDFKLVREDLRERETLLRIAAHLVRPLPFLVPMYRFSAFDRLGCGPACCSTTCSRSIAACQDIRF